MFLGFGFHQQNMDILQVSGSVPWRRVLSTVVGIDEPNWDTLRLKIAMTVGCPNPKNVQLLNLRSHEMLPKMKLTVLANV